MGQILRSSTTTTKAGASSNTESSSEPERELASRYGINPTTVATWRRPELLHGELPASSVSKQIRELKSAQERHQVLLLLCGQFVAEDQVEELDRVVQRQQTLIMQVGRVVLDASQRESLDLPVPDLHHEVDHFRLEEALSFEIVHQIVGVKGRLMAARALALAEEDLLSAHFGWRRLGGNELAEQVELGRGREVQYFLEVGHEVDLASPLERVHALLRSDHDVAVEIGSALLELGEILDRLQGTLRAEQPLDVHAAERHGLDAVAEPLRADTGIEVRGAVLVAVRMAIEASRTLAGHCRFAIVGGIELLLRERRQQ